MPPLCTRARRPIPGSSTTALFLAAQNGFVDAVQRLCGVCAGKEPLLPPLLQACQNNQVRVVRVLIAQGADVNAVNPSNGVNALVLSSFYGHLDVVQALVKAGADVNSSTPDGVTPAYFTAQQGHTACLQYLWAHGADVTRCMLVDGWTPLIIAASKGRVGAVNFLCEVAGGCVNTAASSDGSTALHEAASAGALPCVRVLLRYGADARARRFDGFTPADVAKAAGHVHTAQHLEAHSL